MREIIKVGGMSCAACSARIEKSLRSLKGVNEVYANFSSNVVNVEYDENSVSHDRICEAIEKCGYYVKKDGNTQPDMSRTLKRDLLISCIFSIPVIIISMGPMFGLILIDDYLISAIIQLILCIPVILAGRRFYLRGIPALLHGSPIMDTLVALGSGTAFIYSVAVMVTYAAGGIGETHLYFESAVMILTLISVGKYLESRTRERTDDAVKGLRKLVPDTATVIENGAERIVSAEELKADDILVIRPGERIPADSVIITGASSFDESMLTGESMPVSKTVSDTIYAGTINTDGSVTAKVIAVGEDSVLHGIIRMIEEAQSTKAPIARLADRVAARFVPAVILIAVAAMMIWLIAGKDIGFALTILISVLVISCPCAMGLATPLAITVGTGKAAEYGILFRDAPSLEHAGRVDCIVLDKTGTVTEGRPAVNRIYPENNEDEILYYAAAAEKYSEHPVSVAICDRYRESGHDVPESYGFEAIIGSGVICTVDGRTVSVGNAEMMAETDMSAYSQTVDRMLDDGSSAIYVKIDGSILGIIFIRDSVRDTAQSSVRSLHEMGLAVKMVTGDSEKAAHAISESVGITDTVACARPGDKLQIVKKLQATGHDVAMVGDGINDAPALTQADLGIAVGSGTDIAIDSADVIIMNDDIRNVPASLEIGCATLKNIKENLFFAFCYNAVCIPIAAGLPYLFGIGLIECMPMISAAAMSLSSLSVVSNALRLKRFVPKSL